MTDDSSTDRTILQTALLAVLREADTVREDLERLRSDEMDSTQAQNDGWSGTLERFVTPARGLVLAAITTLLFSQSVLAQSGGGGGGTNICNEGFGLLIFDVQMMAWQVIIGALFAVFLLGIVLRAVPLFTGATAMGSLMMIGPIVGVLAFLFFVQFIDIALGYAGGPGIGEGCSPFV